jgi:hypothetical protein
LVPVACGGRQSNAGVVLGAAKHPATEQVLLARRQSVEKGLDIRAQLVLSGAVALIGFDDDF